MDNFVVHLLSLDVYLILEINLEISPSGMSAKMSLHRFQLRFVHIDELLDGRGVFC